MRNGYSNRLYELREQRCNTDTAMKEPEGNKPSISVILDSEGTRLGIQFQQVKRLRLAVLALSSLVKAIKPYGSS
jgi:hypothetical protein